MARNEGISELKTETFSGVESIIESIIDYASKKDVDLIVIGTRGRTGLEILDGKCSKRSSTTCSLSCLTC